MMKNVYYLASNIERDKFRLDVKYQSDTTGVYLSYIPEPQVKNQTLIKLLNADRLDNNNNPHSNGYFDYVEGYTISNGRVFFPMAEPFGNGLRKALTDKGVTTAIANKIRFSNNSTILRRPLLSRLPRKISSSLLDSIVAQQQMLSPLEPITFHRDR